VVEELKDAPPAEESDQGDFGGPVKPFLDHLEDLRWVIIKTAVALAVGMIACLCGAKFLVEFLQAPLINASGEKIMEISVIGPLSGFTVALRLAFWGGLALSFPLIAYFIGDFVVPALKSEERKYLYAGFGIGAGLFAVGATFAYKLILPFSALAFMRFNEWIELPSSFWTAQEYFPFVSKLVLGVGFSFELPVVILTLVRLGVLSHETLAKGRKYMVVGNLILAAFITPQDIFTTIMMAAPLQVLYEICIWIAAFWARQERKRQAEAESDTSTD
jgi:sec-independent protein translocase protein TatC